LHDVFSNAAAWSALNYSSKILKKTDRKLAKQAAHAATELEKSFNKDKKGFRIKRNKFYAEALDGKLQKLAAPSIDVGMSLAMDFEGRLIIPKKYQKPVVKKLVSNEFYDSQFGLRDYSRLIKNYSNQDQYHRGPQTYWPFTEALVAKGFINAGYKNCAAKALNSLLLGLAEFGSFVELFQVEDDKAVLWHNPATKQSSSRNQAWSAAAAYYASSYLLNLWESRLS
jgi:glycogen debranching enzyme